MKKTEKSNSSKEIFYAAFTVLLADLPERSREIIAKRFGVFAKEPMTLQAIGDDYTITRERVRQIVQSGLRTVREMDDHVELESVKNNLLAYITKNHGIVLEEKMIDDLAGSNYKERGSVRFFIEGLAELDVVNAKKYPVEERVIMFHAFDTNKWHDIHATVKKILHTKKQVHTSTELHQLITDEHADIHHEQFVKYMIVSREIGKNPFDKWGLIEWDEISPRGVREKALLIMKEKNKPMHFREIAAAIDEHGLGKKGRKSHPQTVHNELIRDNNFVLVGRGVYALNTKGYIEGTVKDVIEDVLKNAKEPLSAEEIVARVLKMRYVKPSTVRVNLNAIAKKLNKKYTLGN
jgi:predicted Zn-ribbon and HTH transcriptional regulator